VGGLGKYVTCDEFHFFLSFFFCFLQRAPMSHFLTDWHGLSYTPKRVFPAKDVLFGGLDNIRLHLGGQTPKTSTKWAGIGIS